MKSSILTILLVLLVFSSSNAQKSIYVRAGNNYTFFRGEKTNSKPGYSFAVGHQKSYLDKRGLFLSTGWSFEIVYITKKATLEEKTIGGGLGFDYVVSYNDIHCSVTQLELPILLRYDFSLDRNLKAQFHLGPALSFGLNDRSSVDRQRVETLEPDQRSTYPFDYVVNPGDPPETSSSGLLLYIGAGFSFSRFSFDLRYSPSILYEFKTIQSIDLYETPDTVHFLVTFNFNP